ncbi:hypothetical protein E0Z10_g8057 [Xylaria hypoxylon]|uniref:Adhesin domain-containing protein n=1 Tax=Xylaria hypoxylon TaxID=37992 RepID=A0A4Z0YNX4_9PEZI|nr:hypothetical protein E0Z10_g8057 [Xylaria hypoxylon]
MNEDSDGEDYANQLSPSNGQSPASSSNQTPYIPNIFIPDPTLQQRIETGAESKAREADEDWLLSPQTESRRHSAESSFSRSSSRLEQAATATSELLPHHHHHHHHRHHREITYSQSSASQSASQVFSNRAWPPSVYSEAPPAYSPSPVSLTPSGITSQQDRPRNYSTFGISRIMGTSEVEGERLLGHQPESMGAPADEESATPAWARGVRRHLPAWLNWKYGLLALAALIVSITVLSGIASSSHSDKGHDSITPPASPVDKEPEVQIPDGSESPELPGQESFCQGGQHRYDDQILSLDFERSQNLTFRETGYRHSGSVGVRVGGQINVRRLTDGGDPRMVLEIVTNEPDLRLYTSLDAEMQEIRVSVPETYETSVSGQRPCVEIKGTIWVPQGAEIGILSLRAIHLGILLFDDLSLQVADYTELSSVAGSITAGASESNSHEKNTGASLSNPDYTFVPAKDSWAFDSRVIEVRTTSGSIDGNWPLYDLLGLHTTSGSIQVSITPEEELENYPKSAVLSLSTISGSISATEPVHDPDRIPRRDYLVDVKSTSGSLKGALAFSAGITVHSTASSIALDLLPVINIDKINARNPAQLETVTTSGGTAVRVLEPKYFDGNGKALGTTTETSAGHDTNDDKEILTEASRVLDCLEATHKSTSGSVGLRYPQTWEGVISAETTSGRLVARGKDLKIIKSSGGWPGSMMEGRKGTAGKKSTIQVHVLLGSMDALIGDEL